MITVLRLMLLAAITCTFASAGDTTTAVTGTAGTTPRTSIITTITTIITGVTTTITTTTTTRPRLRLRLGSPPVVRAPRPPRIERWRRRRSTRRARGRRPAGEQRMRRRTAVQPGWRWVSWLRWCRPRLRTGVRDLPGDVMRSHAARLCTCLALLAGASPALLAEDELHLANGAVIVGEIVAETPSTVQIRTQAMLKHSPLSATLTVERDQIENRLTVPSFAVQYQARAAASPDTPEGHLALARWSIERCLVAEAEANVLRADALDTYNPLVAQFYKELGFIRVHDHWVREDGTSASAGAPARTPPLAGSAANAALNDQPAAVLAAGRAPGSTVATPVDAISRPLARTAAAPDPAPAPAAEGSEVAVTAQAVPAAVLAVMTSAARGHPLSDYVRDLEEGAVVYSAVFTGADKVAMEVTVSKDAELIDVSPLVDEPEKPTTVTLAGAGPAAAPGAPAAAPAAAEATEVEITPQQVPAAVLAVMAKASAGRPLTDFVRDLEQGVLVYSAEFTTAAGTLMEVTVSKDAQLLDVAPEVDDKPAAR